MCRTSETLESSQESQMKPLGGHSVRGLWVALGEHKHGVGNLGLGVTNAPENSVPERLSRALLKKLVDVAQLKGNFNPGRWGQHGPVHRRVASSIPGSRTPATGGGVQEAAGPRFPLFLSLKSVNTF